MASFDFLDMSFSPVLDFRAAFCGLAARLCYLL